MPESEIKIYQLENGQTEVQVRFENETVWLNQYQLEELFETDRTSIARHISNIYNSEELDKDSTCAKIAQVQNEGNRQITRQINFYNLDAVISVGYRVNSKRGTQFRIWANKILKEYLIKGYSLNEKRLVVQNKYLKKFKSQLKYLIMFYSIKNYVNYNILAFIIQTPLKFDKVTEID